MSKVHEIVTERILEQLAKGVVPWKKPWVLDAGTMPQSVAGRAYRGINTLLLGMMPYDDPRWITYKKAQELGGQVRKGEKSTLVTFWKGLEIDAEDKDGNPVKKTIPFLRYYNVFNVTQVDGLWLKPLQLRAPVNTLKAAEAIALGFPNPPSITYNGLDRAYYNRASDSIHLPSQSSFTSTEGYYETLFHELGHSTGHPSRLDREMGGFFGCETYAKEELVAEFTAAFLCHTVGIEQSIESTSAYIDSWIKVLKSDKTLLVNAASKAQKAMDYILGDNAQELEQAA